MMTEDCCAILDPALLTGWSADRVWPIAAPPSNMHLHHLWNNERDTVHKTQQNTLLSANLQPKRGQIQLQVLNLWETTKKGCGGGGDRIRGEAPLKRKSWYGREQLQLKNKNKGPGNEWVTATQLGQDKHCVCYLSLYACRLCAPMCRDRNSAH